MGIRERLRRIDWQALEAALDEQGFAIVPGLLPRSDCKRLTKLYTQDERFRSTIDMARHRFGEGEYRYFDRPLPSAVQTLRNDTYPALARIANRWMRRLGEDLSYPRTLAGFLRRCHADGQVRPTPLLLRYEKGGYNRLHQDLYGPMQFPIQMTVLLSDSERDFEGGEFLLVENRPRQQSIGQAIRLRQGEAVFFPNDARPVQTARGFARARVRHGVSRLRSGERLALGVIFHDAR